MSFKNVYADEDYASAYSKLKFPGTYYLAFRDIPSLISKYVKGKNALDIGCGTGRSTRFLKEIGFNTIGVDIAQEMVTRASEEDPYGDYRVVCEGDLSEFSCGEFDLVLSAFTFDNIPTKTDKVKLLREMSRIIKPDGRIINLVSSPDIYLYEWASFSTRDFPENRLAKTGDFVRIIVTELDDKRPAVDILWFDENYRENYLQSDLRVIEKHNPLGESGDGYNWVTETEMSPWSIYVLCKT